MPSSTRPRVVILGAGFGGLNAAKALAKDADVTVVDRHNFQTFLPLLYQVSTAGLAADHVVHPVRGALRGTGIKFRMGSPISVDHKNRTVKLDSSEVLEFDHLIVALGSVTADFGVPGVSEYGLDLDGVRVGVLLLAALPDMEAAAADWAGTIVFTLRITRLTMTPLKPAFSARCTSRATGSRWPCGTIPSGCSATGP